MESLQRGSTTAMPPLTTSKPAWSPHSYQKRGISMALQMCCALLLDPGLGKTAIMLAVIKILLRLGYIKHVLVVAPKNVILTAWPGELNKWADFAELKYLVLHGKDKDARLKQSAHIYLINPEGLTWLFAQAHRPNFDMLVVDESTKFKDSQTQRFKLLRKHIDKFARRYILTGTVIPNGLQDLFGQIFIVDLGASLGRYVTHYRNQFFDSVGYGGYTHVPKEGAFEAISERIKPIALRLAAEDYLDMPELIQTTIPVEMPEDAWKIYRPVYDAYVAAVGDHKIVAGNKAVAGMKCRQIANGAVYANKAVSSTNTRWMQEERGEDPEAYEWIEIHTAKLDALEDLLEQIGNQPVLLLYEFKHDYERICKRLGDIPTLSGSTEKNLSQWVSDFNSGKLLRLCGHPASMGHGLNLQGACHHIVMFGPQWNFDYMKQAIARVYRQGQRSDKVFVYYLVSRGTKDEEVGAVLVDKDATQEKFNRAIGWVEPAPADPYKTLEQLEVRS